MTKADRKWAAVTTAILLLLSGSWLYGRDGAFREFPLLNVKCSLTTAGHCGSVAGTGGLWEAHGSAEYTITSEVVVPSNQVANCYLLGTGPHGSDATTRMPKSWALYGSDDGRQWNLLDTRSDQKEWITNESRYYPMGKKASPRYVQLRIQSSSPGNIVRLYRFRFGACPQF